MDPIAELARLDRETALHPFTNLSDFASGKLGEPRIVETGKGIRIRDARGVELIDGFAGLYCVNIGYGRQEVAEAIAAQARKLAYYHTYAAHTTEQLTRLGARLVRTAPAGMKRVFYGLSGSDGNETQAKLVWHYFNLAGQPKKKKIIARERGYHGCTVIAGSMTGMSFYHDRMDLPLPIILRTGVPHHYWGAQAGESEEAFSARRAKELEALILKEGPDTVGAMIAEPMLGTGGIIPPPAGYWREIQAVLRRYDILLIADEVITAFGRLGAWYGSTAYDIEPDLITVAKGLTSGYVPMSAVLIGGKVAAALERAGAQYGPFSHGYTYSGHPLGAAAANAALDIVEKENLVANAGSVGAAMLEQLRQAMADIPIVGEVRGAGLLMAVEFVRDRKAKTRFEPALGVGARVSRECLAGGLIARAMPHGDILGLAPPLVLTAADAADIVRICRDAVLRVYAQVKGSTG